MKSLFENSKHESASLLACPTQVVMTKGGDDRLHVSSETGVNKYYTSATPLRDTIARSSCTSSSPSQKGFECADLLRQKLLISLTENNFDKIFSDKMSEIRKRIIAVFVANKKSMHPYVMVTPSGSDAEMMITLLALSRHPQWNKNLSFVKSLSEPLVCNIVVAAGEVGSGTAGSAGCCHFSTYVPYGKRVVVGQTVWGIPDGAIEVVQLSARDDQAGLVQTKKFLEEKIEKLIDHAIKEKRQIVVLHMVHCSKTGIGTPCIAFVKKIKHQYGDKVVVAIDAAQGRFSDIAVQQYIEMEAIVLFTGSKFFAGPSFSGVIFIPEKEVYSLEKDTCYIPNGLGNYFSKYDVDDRLKVLRRGLSLHKNIGLMLRWEAALYEIERFYSIDSVLRDEVIECWVDGAKELFSGFSNLHLFDEPNDKECLAELDTVLAKQNTVISFTIYPEYHEKNYVKNFIKKQKAQEETALNVLELKQIHRWMSQDVSSKLPEMASVEEHQVARQKCLIGQPVKITSKYGVLRIALGAPMVTRMVSAMKNFDSTIEDNISSIVDIELADDKKILEKLSLIAKYFFQESIIQT